MGQALIGSSADSSAPFHYVAPGLNLKHTILCFARPDNKIIFYNFVNSYNSKVRQNVCKKGTILASFCSFQATFYKKNSRLQSDLNLYSLQTTWPSPRLLVWNVMRAAVGKCQDAHEIEFHLPMCYAVIYGPKRYGKLRYTGTRPDGRLSDDLRFTSWLRCCYKDVTNLLNATCCIHLKTLKTTNGK